MAHILVVDDEVRFQDLYVQTLAAAGLDATAVGSAQDAWRHLRGDAYDLVISDVRMPGDDGLALLRRVRETRPKLPFLLVTAYADVRSAVEALKLGAVDYLSKPVDLEELLAAVRDTLGLSSASLPDVPREALAGVVAESPAMRALLRDAWSVARSSAPVLLAGESGAGKDVVATFIHGASPRWERPMVSVNCAALPDGLLGSELFGHAKGAFTGATAARLGRFREADRSTIFLDEIGDMPLALQPALLRVLETGRVTPLGSDGEVAVDFRLVAATHQDLQRRVEEGRFRQDLFYRLNVIQLQVPPLRERPEDIVPLARQLIAASSRGPKRLSRAAVRALQAYHWPGNVRELLNAVKRAALLSGSDVLLPEHLPPAVRAALPPGREPDSGEELAPTASAGPAHEPGPGDPGPSRGRAPGTLEESEAQAIQRALEATGGNRTRAAELLGVSRRGLIYKLKRYGLS